MGRIVGPLSTYTLVDGTEVGRWVSASNDYHGSVGQLYTEWAKLRFAIDNGDESVRLEAVRTRLSAVDRHW